MDTVQDAFATFGAMRHKLLLLYKNVANVVAVNMREISGLALLSIGFSTFSQLSCMGLLSAMLLISSSKTHTVYIYINQPNLHVYMCINQVHPCLPYDELLFQMLK